ncbi:hypothetical protein FDECE_4746 [Fusarium decemcellulare]|nr:hypothetical protein FDECE_4746 [Fusarium decemcellulare]
MGLRGQETRLLVAMRRGQQTEWEKDELPRYLEGYRNAMHCLTTIANCAVPLMPPLHNLLLLGEDKQEKSQILSKVQYTEDRDMFRRSLLHLALDLGVGDNATHLLGPFGFTGDMDAWHRHPLHIASSAGSINMIIRLIDKNADLELADSRGLRALHYASAAGHEDIVRLLADKVEINPQDHDRRTPLSHSARNGHTAVVSMLLKKKPNIIESQDLYGWTPLSHAIASGRIAVVELLLEKGARISPLFETGGCMIFDFNARHLSVVKLLLKSAIVTEEGTFSIRKLMSDGGKTALSYASELGELDVVVKLLEEQVDPNTSGRGREPPLWKAVRAGNMGIVKKLLSHGADPNWRNSAGLSTLTVAITQRDKVLTQMLVDSGAV